MPISRWPKGRGIYALCNKENGRRYVGQGEFKSRWPVHIRLLRRAEHHNKALQADWDACGEPAFEFKVLETVADDRFLLTLEQRYILETIDSYNADASTRLIHADRGERGVQALPETCNMSISDLWGRLMRVNAGMDYQATRRYWYGTRDGNRGGARLQILNLLHIAAVADVLGVPVGALAELFAA